MVYKTVRTHGLYSTPRYRVRDLSDFVKKEVPFTQLNLNDADNNWANVLISKVKKEIE
jgi:hypothetical protein